MSEHAKHFVYTSAERRWQHWKLVRPTLHAYCNRVEGQLVNLPKSKLPNPQWAIFDAFDHSVQYGKQLSAWIDSDVIVAEDAPNMFALGDKMFVCEPKNPWHMHPKWKRGWHTVGGRTNPRPYPVTGIMVWTYRHALALSGWMKANAHRFPASWGDQEVLATALWECDLSHWFFPADWHRMAGEVRPETPFKHAAGPNRKTRKCHHFINLNRQRLNSTPGAASVVPTTIPTGES